MNTPKCGNIYSSKILQSPLYHSASNSSLQEALMTDRDGFRRPTVNDGEGNKNLVLEDNKILPMNGLLVDSYGRRIKSMRISITDKCNFRCTYCMPAEGLPWLKKAEILSYEEIERITRVAVSIGIEQLRLTTNGILLKQPARALAEAGLNRINVSLDSLVREKFAQLTRRDQFERVLEGLEELEKYPSIHPIKINAVAIRGYSEEEVLDFARLARRKAYVMRWIEFMPLDADQIWRKEDILTGAELKAIIEAEYGPLVPITTGDPSETARR